MFIVFKETYEGVLTAETKATRLGAVRAYKKLDREQGSKLKSYGWSEAESAQPAERVAAGLPAFA